MKKIEHKPFRWASVFSILMAFSVTFVLLDTFVIPRAGTPIATKSTTAATVAAAAAQNTPVITSTSYKDADIQVSSVDYLKTAFAKGTYGRNIKETTSAMAIGSDGRTTESAGLSLLELAQGFSARGCAVAYNLDGGGSATMSLMFLYPLLGGVLPFLLLWLFIPQADHVPHYRLSYNCYNSGIASLTVKSMLKGVFEIAGTSSPYLIAFTVCGWAMLVIGLLAYVASLYRRSRKNPAAHPLA